MNPLFKWMTANRPMSATIGYVALVTGIGIYTVSTAYDFGIFLAAVGAFFLAPIVFLGPDIQEKITEVKIVDMQAALDAFPELYTKINEVKSAAGDIEIIPNGGKKLLIVRDGQTIAYVFVRRGKYDVAWAKVGADKLLAAKPTNVSEFPKVATDGDFVAAYLNGTR